MGSDIMLSICILSAQIRKQIDRSHIKREIDDITGTHGWIICYLADHEDCEIYGRDLEREFGFSRATASKILGLMEKNGMIERSHVPGDDRLKRIVLTERAHEYISRLRALNLDVEHTLIRGFSDSELRTLREYLSRMRSNLAPLSQEERL